MLSSIHSTHAPISMCLLSPGSSCPCIAFLTHRPKEYQQTIYLKCPLQQHGHKNLRTVRQTIPFTFFYLKGGLWVVDSSSWVMNSAGRLGYFLNTKSMAGNGLPPPSVCPGSVWDSSAFIIQDTWGHIFLNDQKYPVFLGYFDISHAFKA